MPIHTTCRRLRAGGRLLLAVVAAVAVAGSAETSASTISSAGEAPAAAVSGRDHHDCKCSKTCRGACCCVKAALKRAAQAPSTPTPRKASGAEAKSDADAGSGSGNSAGPCIGSAPCGGEGVPGQSAGARVLKSAILRAATSARPTLRGVFLGVPSDSLDPSSFDLRDDEPPETPAPF